MKKIILSMAFMAVMSLTVGVYADEGKPKKEAAKKQSCCAEAAKETKGEDVRETKVVVKKADKGTVVIETKVAVSKEAAKGCCADKKACEVKECTSKEASKGAAKGAAKEEKKACCADKKAEKK
ncbi:MAG: hypothetical protein LBD53_11500 [Tannerella sp.]|jgi:hypothetical protein|nr:hypothetical protein [Tannerella sp.]